MSTSKAATFVALRSIAKRNLTTFTPTRNSPRHQLLRSPPFCQTLASTSVAQVRKIPRNHFTSNRILKQDTNSQNNSEQASGKTAKRNSARKAASNNSLRKVAVEAQRSRWDLSIQGSGRYRYGDLDADTKEVTAYCAAETYNLSRARWDLHDQGFVADPFGTGLFPQVLHIQTPNFVIKNQTTSQDEAQGAGDVFVFPSGCVVTWNVPERLAHTIVERFLAPSAGDSGHVERMEIEDLDYIEDPNKETSRIIGDTIILGTKKSTDSIPETPNSSSPVATNPEVDTVLAKIAFSSALARSTKLAVLENRLSHYFSTTRSIPTTLSSGQTLRFTRSQILRKTGELLSIRAQLNLYSELTDSLPDLFWDSPHELGLEGYYEMVGRALDVGVRIKVLNEKMDYASEIAAVLRERLSEKHSTGLEWMIIGLICIEVIFGIIHLWREREREDDEKRTRELLEVYLERELKKKA